MKKLYLLIYLCLSISCMHLNKQKNMEIKKISIAFQDFFENDIVSVELNKCLIVKDILLNSSKDIGNTGVVLYVDNKNRVFIGQDDIITTCNVKLKVENTISIILNGNKKTFNINLSKGSYFGFDKKGDDVFIIQSKLPFEYD